MIRRHTAAAAALLFATTALVGCSDDDGAIDVSDSTTSSSTPGAGASVTTSTTSDAVEPGAYLEETRPGAGTVTLVLFSAAGEQLRDVLTASTYANGDDPAASPILDAELAPDGTVYVVERTDTSEDARMRPGGTRLVAVAAGGAVSTVKENVVGSELSPDGTRMAIVVLSPDGDGDGQGTQALRVLDLASGDVDEVWASPVALDAQGVITQEVGRTEVVGWTADQSTLIVQQGCCDSGSVSLVPSSGGSGSPETWPTVQGDHLTYALGFDPDGRVLVQRNTFTGDGIEVPTELAGIEVVALGADGSVSDPVWTGPADDQQEAVHFELVGTEIEGTPLPIAAQGSPLLFGAGDERTPRRFV